MTSCVSPYDRFTLVVLLSLTVSTGHGVAAKRRLKVQVIVEHCTHSRCKKSLSTKVSTTSSLRSAHLRVHEGVRESFQAPPGRQSSAEGPLRSWPHAQLTATSVPMDTSLLDSTMAALTLRAGHSAATHTGMQR
jgi:hypothetical protein